MNYSIYAESTPNPNVMKFVANKILTQKSVEFTNPEEANKLDFAKALFAFPFVTNIFLNKNFISITKNNKIEWKDIVISLRVFIVDFLNNKVKQKNTIKTQQSIHENHSEEFLKERKQKFSETEKEIIKILDEYIRPAILLDGGDIELNSLKDGVVNVILRGACSGCPSSTATLKQGIQTLLQQKLGEEIKEVVAINL